MNKRNLLGIIAAAGLGLASVVRADPVTNIEMTVTNNCTVDWLWGTQYMVKATSADALKGNVSGNTNDWLDLGSNATINATASNHYHFLSWSNAPVGQSTANPLTFAVTNNLYTNLLANFAIDQKTVTVNNGGYGTANPGTTNVDYGATITQRLDNLDPVVVSPGTRRVIKGVNVTGNSYTPLP
jgi:hypothetical protein